MYEAIAHWNKYQKQIKAKQEMDKFLNKIITKNGVTKYQYDKEISNINIDNHYTQQLSNSKRSNNE